MLDFDYMLQHWIWSLFDPSPASSGVGGLMGYSKIVEKTASPNRVRIVHQLDSNGDRYAEDIIIEGPEGRHLVNGEVGDIGTAGVYWTKASFPAGYTPSIDFPE